MVTCTTDVKWEQHSYFRGCLVSTLVHGTAPWPRETAKIKNSLGQEKLLETSQTATFEILPFNISTNYERLTMSGQGLICICNCIHPETWIHHWLMFEMCNKDIIHTMVIEIRGAVSCTKDRSQICFKVFSLSQSPFLYTITLPGSTNFIWTENKLSPSTAWDVYASVRNYSDCSKRGDIWSSIKTAGQRGFFANFFWQSIWNAFSLLSV